jgi:predicted CXXCH cytochrome family protein
MSKRKPGRPPPPSPAPPAPHRRRLYGLIAGLVAAVALALLAWGWWRQRSAAVAGVPAADPRLTTATPYRNVRPEVRYVGDAACAECHPGEADTYREHPMGRSLSPVARVATAQRYDESAHNPFDADGFRYRVERQGDRVFHQQTGLDPQGRVLTDNRIEIDFAIGSGTRAYSYLINRDGFLFESPITWYTQKEAWDLSPGYPGTRLGFKRAIRPDCLFCHCNRADHVEHTVGRYREPVFDGYAIGCERCHGPGELHVARRERADAAAGPDETIVNPARLDTPLRDAVCEQCHLQGAERIVRRGLDAFAYRPGLPLHLFLSVFVRPAEFTDHQLVGQVEQMQASRCFRDSREPNKLGCISCHDPHAVPAPAQRVAYYRGRCLQCHGDRDCTLPPAKRRQVSADDSCIACHMPRLPTADIAHTAVTEHRILRRAEGPARPFESRLLRPGEVPLVHFHRDLADPHDPEFGRDVGLAVADLVREASPVRRQLAETALPYLDAAVRRGPEDVPAWEARGEVLAVAGRTADALASCERALALAPGREQSLADAATFAAALGRRSAAIAYWQRAVAVNPWATLPRFQLARLWAEGKEWDKAVPECREVLKVDPTYVEARMLLVTYHLDRGDRAQARAEFDTVLALHPADPEKLRRWYAEQTR